MYTKNSINVKSYNGLNIVHWNIDGLIYNVDGSKFSKIEDPHEINLLNKQAESLKKTVSARSRGFHLVFKPLI